MAGQAKQSKRIDSVLKLIVLIVLGLILGTIGRIWNQTATLGYFFGRGPTLRTSIALEAPTIGIVMAEPTGTASPSPVPPAPKPTLPAGIPLRAAFYYPWFPEAWTQKGITPFTNYKPTLGFYDASDSAIVREHIAAMQYGNIRAGIASWWGQGSPTDRRIPILLKAASGTDFFWTLYYEPEGVGNPSINQIRSDLIYIRDHYAGDPSFLKVAGRMVVFVYADPADSCDMVDRWREANSVNAYIVLKVFSNYRTCSSQPDGWHQYAPAASDSLQSNYSYSISPGFWLAGQQERLPRDLNRWNQSIRKMVASNAPLQLITSFNEWGEGTAVESAREWATASGFGTYLDALHMNGDMKPVLMQPGVTPTNTAITTSTATPDPRSMSKASSGDTVQLPIRKP